MAHINIAAIQLKPGDKLDDGSEVIVREPGRRFGRVIVRTTGKHKATAFKPDAIIRVDRPERKA